MIEEQEESKVEVLHNRLTKRLSKVVANGPMFTPEAIVIDAFAAPRACTPTCAEENECSHQLIPLVPRNSQVENLIKSNWFYWRHGAV